MMNTKLLYFFFLFFIHFCSVYSFNGTHNCSNEQMDALLLFKQNISHSDDDYGPYYYSCDSLHGSVYHPITMNWNKSIDCYHWNGVKRNHLGDVIGLDLRCGMLKGVLELFTLFSRLPHLEVLDLSYNSLSVVTNNVNQDWAGEVGGKKLVYLDLSDNSITGVLELFTLFSRLPHLEVLDLSHNSLSIVTNNVTDNVTPDFRVLRLAHCKLNVFPQFLRAMKNLQLLDLASNNIHGLIPDWAGEVGGNKLVYLDLSNNYITGLSLFQWNGLEQLYLQFNMIRGQFPPSICDMNNLKYLDISNNGFGGMFPQCLGNSRFLVSLNINSNMIRGPFPTTICSNNMTHLKYLDMSNNSFYGVIPQCFENITSSLLMINLGKNNFSGTIPNVNENCRLSEGLLLNNNQLEGDVPRSLLKCQDLKVLDLGNNHLKGKFPRWLEEVTKLEILILRSNNLYGAIETSSTMGFPFSRVKVFDISQNGFVGRLPGEYFENFNAIKDVDKNPNGNRVNISGSRYSIIVPVENPLLLFAPVDFQVLVLVSVIDLSGNKFEGEIPNVIGSLNSLKVLNLSHNNLSGQIPHELGNLLAVESLDLSWNQLSGEIPQSLNKLTVLSVLDVSQNHLEGHIPRGGQMDTMDEISFGGNLGLCGIQINKLCDDRDMIPAQVDNDHGDDGMFPWEVVVLGYGCGTLLGFMMGYRMLSTGKPKWFNAIYDALERMIPIRRKKKKRVNTQKRNQRSNGR